MKKYALTLLSCFSLMHAAEQQITQEKTDKKWDAQAYAAANKIQETAALQFLHESNLNLQGKKVLDVGCGTGSTSVQIAEYAKIVHGIDASKDMIDFARKFSSYHPNITFEHACAEDFCTEQKYNAAITIFVLHWIEHKKDALLAINRALEMGGEFFGTVQTTTDPEPPHFTACKELMTQLLPVSLLQNSLSQNTQYFILPDEDFKSLLTETGFKLLSYEPKKMDVTFQKRQDIENALRPIMMSRPFMLSMTKEAQENFLALLIDKLVKQFPQDDQGNYVMTGAVTSHVFHARKNVDIIW